jgi:prefoldin subunit 5
MITPERLSQITDTANGLVNTADAFTRIPARMLTELLAAYEAQQQEIERLKEAALDHIATLRAKVTALEEERDSVIAMGQQFVGQLASRLDHYKAEAERLKAMWETLKATLDDIDQTFGSLSELAVSTVRRRMAELEAKR